MIHPPRVADWLLERFACGPKRHSLVGDLHEQFRRGQSAAWYWRQTIRTIASGVFWDIRAHKLLALATVAVGFALIQSFAVFVGAPILNRMMRTPGHMDVALVVWPVWSIGFIATGAVIARMARPAHSAMVLLFAAVVLLVGASDQYVLLRDALEHSTFWFRLLLFIVRDLTWTVSVVAGGVWSSEHLASRAVGTTES